MQSQKKTPVRTINCFEGNENKRQTVQSKPELVFAVDKSKLVASYVSYVALNVSVGDSMRCLKMVLRNKLVMPRLK